MKYVIFFCKECTSAQMGFGRRGTTCLLRYFWAFFMKFSFAPANSKQKGNSTFNKHLYFLQGFPCENIIVYEQAVWKILCIGMQNLGSTAYAINDIDINEDSSLKYYTCRLVSWYTICSIILRSHLSLGKLAM